MLDAEIYGLIVALGVLLAMLFTAVLCVFYAKENFKLSKKYDYDDQVQDYVKKEWTKVYALIILELALFAVLLLVKVKLF